MKLSHDGLTLWYGTPDAPAPPEERANRSGPSLTVGTQPPNPGNNVAVQYRLDGGPTRVVRAREAGTDYIRQVQYFRATFPPLPEGNVVEYRPELTCGGRQVPSPAAISKYPSRFRLAELDLLPAPEAKTPRLPELRQRFSPRPEFAAAVSTRFSKNLDVIGETPLGLRVNYYLEGGHFAGPRLKGRVLRSGGDYLLVRRDGIGSIQVSAVFETSDGARLGADYYGMVDLGPDGYQRAVRGDLPSIASLQLAPRFMTGDPRYAWVNRYQFIGVGQVVADRGAVEYDLFVLSSEALSGR